MAATARSSLRDQRRETVGLPTPAVLAPSSTVMLSNPRIRISEDAAARMRPSACGSRGRPRLRRTSGADAVVFEEDFWVDFCVDAAVFLNVAGAATERAAARSVEGPVSEVG